MARPKKTEETKVEDGNIKDFNVLKKNYITKKMSERTLIALRTKLVSLFIEKKATEREIEFMEIILRNDRKTGKISDKNLFMLNKKEYEELELEPCVVKVDNPPAVHHLYKDLECKFTHTEDFERVVVYIPQKIPAMFQMTNEAAFRLTNGLSPKDGDFPDDKTLIHRVEYSQKEFDAWFDVLSTLEDEEKEDEIETITF